MPKTLIIGSKGSLGQQLIKAFGPDSEITAWDKEEIDITDQEMVKEKVSGVNPDLIINAAAYNAVDKCEEDEEQFELAKRVNAYGVGYLAQAALDNNATIIHYVSDYVFDGEKREGYREDDETNPISKYGQTKVIGESEILKLRDRGLKWYLIRTSKLFGPKGISDVAKDSFFDLILNLRKERKEFNMVHNEEISCFTYTPDLAKATKELVDNKPFDIYHIVNSGPCSWYDGAKYMFELKGINDVKLNPVDSSVYPRPAKRPKYSVLLNTKLEPMRNWKEALKEYYNL